ncbi:MAG: hypothetical protein KDD44_01245 [Bdellovibrionales bacterium]|nr:hypothetical protein [Bdellovibrionales bacterium]
MRSYGKSFEGNDPKAVNAFKMYETDEKVRRLQTELVWLKNGRVDPKVCDAVIGRTRAVKYQSYQHWAELCLHWLSSAKR